MRVSDYIAQTLAGRGIREVFTVTGGVAMYLNDSLGHHEALHCTYHHHEQAAAMAAEAYARLTNRAACVCVTAGPGAVNAMTGVLCAWMESMPMVVLSGQVRYDVTVRKTGLDIRTMGVQEYDVTRSSASMTKYAVMVTDKTTVRYELEKALYLAEHGRKGPVWLDIPLDIQASVIEPEALKGFDPAAEGYEETAMIPLALAETIIDRIAAAERPVLFAGSGARQAGCVPRLRQLIRVLGIPVTLGASSVDLVPYDEPLFCGISGIAAGRAGNFALQNADVYLSIGSRQSLSQTGFNYRDWARCAFTILNDIDENELKKPNLHVSLPVVGDAADLVEKLLAVLERRGCSETKPLFAGETWLARCRRYKTAYPVVTAEEKGPQSDGRGNIYNFYDKLSQHMPADEVLVVSCGTSRVAGTQAFRVKEGQRFITNSQTASMGYGLPACVGVARGYDGAITLVTGEGSLMMNLQELQTLATNHVPVRIFLIDNEGYHSIRQTQKNFFGGRPVGIGPESGDLGFPDMALIARAFGYHYAECLTNDTMDETLAAVYAASVPLICRVAVTKQQTTMPKAASRRLEDGSMVSSPLEDMAPFLSREELRDNMMIPLTEAEMKA